MLEDDQKEQFKKEEEKLLGITPEEELEAELTDQDIEIMGKLGKEVIERKETETKEIQATKDKIFARVARQFPIKIKSDDNEVLVFKAKRLTEKERVTMNRVNTNLADPYNMTDDEYEALQRQSYELLSIVIVDPVLTVDEWEGADLALVQSILEKVSVLQAETNDAQIIDQMRNL